MELVSIPMRDPTVGGLCSPTVAERARAALSRWPHYSPTSLLSLDLLGRDLDLGGIWLKYEGSRFGVGSFKALGAAYALECLLARQRGTYAPGQETARPTIACASDGNYGRGVAWAAQQLRCPCIVYLPAQVTEFRERAIQRYGTRTVRIAGNYDATELAVKRACAENGWALLSDSSYDDFTDVPRDVMAGYGVMLSEIADQLSLASISHVFLQCGVGSFAGAVCDYLHSALGSKAPTLVSVEPVRAACILESAKRGRLSQVGGSLDTIMAGLACGRPSPQAWDLLRTRLNFCTSLDDSWAARAVRMLASGRASAEPVIAGETGAAGVGALLYAASNAQWRDRLGLNSASRVLLFCTEGATDPGIHARIVAEESDTFPAYTDRGRLAEVADSVPVGAR